MEKKYCSLIDELDGKKVVVLLLERKYGSSNRNEKDIIDLMHWMEDEGKEVLAADHLSDDDDDIVEVVGVSRGAPPRNNNHIVDLDGVGDAAPPVDDGLLGRGNDVDVRGQAVRPDGDVPIAGDVRGHAVRPDGDVPIADNCSKECC